MSPRSTQYLDCPICGRAAIPECSRDDDGEPLWECHSEHECKHCGTQLRVDNNEDCVGIEVYDEESMTWKSWMEYA